MTLAGCANDSPVAQKEGAAKPTPVKTVSVMQEEIERTTAQPATVHPYYRAELRAKATGYIKEIKADIGDVVAAGATLAVIDVPEMQKQLLIAQARVTQFQSEEKRAAAGIRLAEAHVQSAQAKLAQAKSEMSRADASLAAMEAEFNRTQDLVQRRSLESRMLDEVRKKRDSERANKQAVASAINSAQAEVTVAQAKHASAQADFAAAQAQTAIAVRQQEELGVLIGYSEIKAPFAGVVTQRSVDPGDLVRSANEVGKGEPLFVISRLDKVRVRIPVPENDAPYVNQGDAITLTLPSFSAEEPIATVVARRAGELDPSTRTMLVEADLPNPAGKLLPGMFGQATITLGTKIAANMLPARAVRFDEAGKAYVYVVTDDATVSVVDVTTGIDNGHTIELTSGLQPGQQVIDAHRKRFANGDKVSLLTN